MTQTIAFLGTGSMNGAILKGLLNSGYEAGAVRATVRSQQSAQRLADSLAGGVRIYSAETSESANTEAVAGAGVVLLGVKPYAILDLAREIAPALAEDTLVVSVAAGVSLEGLQRVLPTGQPVIRCMPNTPSRVGKGVLAISASDSCTAEQVETAHRVLGSVGIVVDIEERQMDAVTAVAGSGPAYAFLLAETMANAGVKLGLDQETATRLAAATVAGAGYLLDDEPAPEALRKAVTSPGGTTEQAILTYQRGGLEDLTENAMRACAEKSAEMTRQYS